MLKTIKTRKLFGIYNYDINIERNLPGLQDNLLFILGPNGMGKTTILRCIDALYHCAFYYFLSIEFESIEFSFETCEITLTQTTKRIGTDEESDLSMEPTISVVCEYKTKGDSQIIENAKWEKKDKVCNTIYENIDNMRLFFESEHCLFISENRLQTSSTDEECTLDAELIKNILVSIQSKFSSNFAISNTSNSVKDSSMSNAYVFEQLCFLKKHNIKLPIDVPVKLSEFNPSEVNLQCIINALNAVEKEMKKVAIFSEILDSLQFINKSYSLSPEYGLRFYANNELKTILTFSQLSSGERHLIYQFYYLVFCPEHYSIALIDEPEISSHLMWQMHYLDKIERIVALTGASFLIATHSTYVFNGDFELTTDLYTQYKQSCK